MFSEIFLVVQTVVTGAGVIFFVSLVSLVSLVVSIKLHWYWG